MSDYYVPDQIVEKILRCLPPESLLRFRSVCKSWRTVIDRPSFVRSHTHNSSSSSSSLLIWNTIGTRLYSLSWDSLNFHDSSSSQTVDALCIAGNISNVPQLPVPTCNGLILFSRYCHWKDWVIWNPLMRKFHQVARMPTEGACFIGGTGLGYDSVADDYKAVRMEGCMRDGIFEYFGTYIYSIKQRSWRRIQNVPFGIKRRTKSFFEEYVGVFVNGSLYWRVWEDSIVGLDLTTEVYRQFPVPSFNTRRHSSDIILSVLDGLLAYTEVYDTDDFDVWVMKKDVWTKLISWRRDFSLQHDIILMDVRPLAYWEKKGEFLFQDEEKFYWCDIVNRSVKKVTLPGLMNSCFTSQIWPGSIFRMSDDCAAVKQPNTKKRKRKDDASTK